MWYNSAQFVYRHVFRQGLVVNANYTFSKQISEESWLNTYAATPQRNSLAECIESHFQDFHEQCRAALLQTAAVREACRADVEQQCHAARPGAGRILLCMKKHFAALGHSCKDAIGHAAIMPDVESADALPVGDVELDVITLAFGIDLLGDGRLAQADVRRPFAIDGRDQHPGLKVGGGGRTVFRSR